MRSLPPSVHSCLLHLVRRSRVTSNPLHTIHASGEDTGVANVVDAALPIQPPPPPQPPPPQQEPQTQIRSLSVYTAVSCYFTCTAVHGSRCTCTMEHGRNLTRFLDPTGICGKEKDAAVYEKDAAA